MLIHSHRFRAGDLEIWQSLEQLDALYAHRYVKQILSKVNKATSLIADFLHQGKAYLGISWGKDSVVVAHLIAEYYPDVPLVWVKVKHRFNPDCLRVRDIFLERFLLTYHEIESEAGEDGETSKPGFLIAEKLLRCDRHISGVRAQESANRRMRGSKNTDKTCAPIANWTTQEVFAYLYQHNLPVHPAYTMSNAGQFNREHLRVAAIGGTRGSQFDRREWEKMYYREFF